MEQDKQTPSQVAAERVALILAATAMKAMELDFIYFGTLMITLLILCYMSGKIKLSFHIPWKNGVDKQ